MKYCCKKLEEFINDSSSLCLESIISRENDKFYIVKKIRSCDDGDGITDTWVDEHEQITYCPFCGKKL